MTSKYFFACCQYCVGSSLAFALSSSCSGLTLRFTHWTSCWCLNGLSFILEHPVDASQERHAPHTEQTNCPSPMPCVRRPFTKTSPYNDINPYDHLASFAPKDVRFLFFCSTALVFCVLLLNGHLTKHNHVARNVERLKLLFVTGRTGIIVFLPFFSSFRLFLTSFASALLKKRHPATQ